MYLSVVTKSEEQTHELAKKLALSITSPVVIDLVGEMGSGKTTFCKGFVKGLGFDGLVSSPTFTILNEYKGKVFDVFHFDFYRIEDPDELQELGFEEYFDPDALKGVTLVEWSERGKWLLPKRFLRILITKQSDTERKFEIRQVER